MKLAELDPWIATVGWTLLHSLWQGWMVYLLLLLIRRMLPWASARRQNEGRRETHFGIVE